MKIHYILCIAIAFPQLALAENASNDRSFGTVQATLDFCTHINPSGATQYEKEARLIEGGKPRETDEFKAGYAWAQAALKKVSEHEGKDACVGFLDPDKMKAAGEESRDRDEKHDDGNKGQNDDNRSGSANSDSKNKERDDDGRGR